MNVVLFQIGITQRVIAVEAIRVGLDGGVQQRLIDAGERVRVYVPFGPEWFGRLVGGLTERPGGVASAVRSLLPGA